MMWMLMLSVTEMCGDGVGVGRMKGRSGVEGVAVVHVLSSRNADA
jgi:hypothetical protein